MNVIQTVIFYALISIIAVCLMKFYEIYSKNSISKDSTIISRKNSEKTSEIFLFLSFLILFIVSASRDHVGTDYNRYVYYYNNIGLDIKSVFIEAKDYGLSYLLISYFFRNLGLSYHWIFAFMSFVTLYFLYKAIVKLSPIPSFSLSLYLVFCLYFQSFNQTRQIAAISIVLYSLTYVGQKKFFKFLFFVLLAVSFHFSAIIFLIIWPLKNFRLNKKTFIIMLILSLLFFAFFDIIIDLFSFIDYVSIYRDSALYSKSFVPTTILNFIVRFIMVSFSVLFYNRITIKDSNTNVYFIMAIICTFSQLGAIRMSIFGRITTYFYVSYIILIPYIYIELKSILKEKYHNLLKVITLCGIILYHYVYYFSPAGAVSAGYIIYNSLLF